MTSLNYYLIVCLFSVLLMSVVLCANDTSMDTSKKDVIGFPEREDNLNLNKENRQPVYIPSVCPVNELYYPGDQKDDWICDCRPAHVYHPATDACWPALQRGPCAEEQYLILPPNSVLPVCEKNPCKADTYVPWNGKCEKLGSTSPCIHLLPSVYALGVNATTLTVNCLNLSLETRFGDETLVIICPPGCRRNATGKCTPIVF